MAYSKELDDRISAIVVDWGANKKNMFGGTCHLLKGNLFCGVWKDYLILRLGDAVAQQALQKDNVVPFDITGHAMKGWVMVAEPGYIGAGLKKWLVLAHDFVKTLPKKK